MKPAAIIYLVTNLVNGNQYVGLTRFDLDKRWCEHRYHAANKKIRTYLYSAMRKYGAENFSITPIASCLFVESASEVERCVIQHLRPRYNQTNGGEFTVGKRVPREVVERIKAKNTGLKRTPEHNKRMSEIKKKQYAENPELRAAATVRINSVRHLIDHDKRIAAVRAKLKGKKMREDVRAHLSKVTMGRRYSRDIIERMARKHDKPVECITLGVTFDSVLEAARHLNIGFSGISKACRGVHQTAGGMRFAFA